MAYKRKSYWNYRVMAHAPSEAEVKQGNTDAYFQVHEVYYKKGKPVSYTEKPVTIVGDSPKEIKWSLKAIKKGSKCPILWYGDRFPEVYKPTKTKKL